MRYYVDLTAPGPIESLGASGETESQRAPMLAARMREPTNIGTAGFRGILFRLRNLNRVVP